MADAARAVRVRIRGGVQGVGFRDWTLRQAETLGLSGWVRNEADGSVTALVAGSEDDVATMIERLREGPRAADVSDLETASADPAEAPPIFRIAG